jgi:hypothetical protein
MIAYDIALWLAQLVYPSADGETLLLIYVTIKCFYVVKDLNNEGYFNKK